MNLPEDVVKQAARFFLSVIKETYATDEGKSALAEWKEQQKKEESEAAAKPEKLDN